MGQKASIGLWVLFNAFLEREEAPQGGIAIFFFEKNAPFIPEFPCAYRFLNLPLGSLNGEKRKERKEPFLGNL